MKHIHSTGRHVRCGVGGVKCHGAGFRSMKDRKFQTASKRHPFLTSSRHVSDLISQCKIEHSARIEKHGYDVIDPGMLLKSLFVCGYCKT